MEKISTYGFVDGKSIFWHPVEHISVETLVTLFIQNDVSNKSF